MSKNNFLHHCRDNHCTPIISIGEPGSGKTYIMLKSLEYWLENNFFDECHLILPSFKNEMNDSYKWLNKYQNVYIYEKFFEKIAEDLLKKCEMNKNKKNKPRYFFAIDDATGLSSKLFQSDVLLKICTQARHYNIQSWYIMHHIKGVIKPAVRNQLKYIFVYNMNISSLQLVYNEMINFKEFRKFGAFVDFWDEYVMCNEHGCLLIEKNKCYNPYCCKWFN